MPEEINEPELQRICAFLQSEDKGRRRCALEEITRSTFEATPPREAEDLENVWNIVHRSLARLLCDQTEACRDRAVDVLRRFLTVLPDNEKNILYIMPILSRRLSPRELIESSEDVRLNCVKLLRLIASKYKEHLSVYMDDFIGILMRTVTDNYPAVKRESCACISDLARIAPRQFYPQSERLVLPVLSNFNHQHYRVRAAAVRTVGDVLQYGRSKSMEDVSTPLAERLFDQSGAVRAAVVQVAGSWLLELKDRYSWWHKIMPLVMTGLHDEVEAIRIKAADLWDATGRQYMKENETDEKLKKKMDFLVEDPPHYPPKLSRPNVGCREIAQQNFCKLVNGIASELGDWMPDVRCRSAQLLCVLVMNVEESVTQHIEKLLPSMYRACNDEDKRVVDNVELAAEYMGYFVPPGVYCRLVLPTLDDTPSAGHLRVLAAMLKGSETTALSSHLESIGRFLRQSHICQSRKPAYQTQLLHCCDSLFSACGDGCCGIAQDVFTVILTTLSMAANEGIQVEAKRLLDVLVGIEKLGGVNDLYLRRGREFLSENCNSAASWTVCSAKSQILSGCFVHATVAIGGNMDVILPVLKEITCCDADAELRLRYLMLLADYFLNGRKPLQGVADLEGSVKSILEDIIAPALVWSAGRAAEAIRTAAVSCLCALLQNDAETFILRSDSEEKRDEVLGKVGEDIQRVTIFPNRESLFPVFAKVHPILVTLADDNAMKTRLYSLKAICLLMAIGRRLSCIEEGRIHQTYPVILKRLDDACDNVRHAAIEALVEVWFNIPENYNRLFNRSHVDALYTTMLIHLDDPEERFQQLMLDALLCLSKIHPELLHQKLQNSRTNFRNQSGVDKLAKHCQGVLKNIQSLSVAEDGADTGKRMK